jgi:Dolichyl-phosphate-mannose-protein mannosyltransferase
MTTTTHESTAPASIPAEQPSIVARDVSAPVPRGVTIGLALALAAIVLARLSAYGIWDPWELTVADAARKLGEGGQAAVQTSATLTLRLVQGSFALFGSREWAGRLPMALSGVALLASLALWVRRYSGTRAGLYAALVLGTTPMFLLHSREMVGATPSFLAATLVAIGASNAVFAGLSSEPARAVWLWLGMSALASVIGIYTQGALLVVLPSLGAVAVAALLLGTPFDASVARERRLAAWSVIGAALLLGVVVARAVARHGAEYNVWTGGTPLDEAVPTFERIVTHLFHGLAPWSAAAPVALGSLLWTSSEGTAARTDAPLRVLCVIWGALAYAAATIYLSSFGAAAFPAPAAIAIAVALWVSELEERKGSYWPELLITVLMVGLLIRDYALYPSSPVDGLELNATLPDKFNPKAGWAGVFGAFAAALVVSCMATRERGELDFKAPYRGLRTLWGRSFGHRAWLVVFALVWLGLVLFGAISVFAPPGVRLTSIARRIGRAAGAVALFAPVALALLQAGFHHSSKLASRRNLPLVLAALVCGVYASQLFLPRLSAHLSPREVFDLFEKLAGPNEPLAQHQVHGRAAAYYVNREVKDIDAEPELVTFLAQPGRHWALLPSERLADVDVAFRRRTGRHLFLPTAENARVSLVASEPIAGKPDANPLSSSVLKTPPKVEHPLNVNFEGKIELIGYNLELPQKDYVGAGQTFTVTWVMRALQSNLGAYQAFLHVDAEGQRINGDHEPVDGMYPVRLWTQGDIVVDRQKVSVPATNPPGKYTMYVGFFRGESRLKVLTGPKDDADRVIAGTIQIR